MRQQSGVQQGRRVFWILDQGGIKKLRGITLIALGMNDPHPVQGFDIFWIQSQRGGERPLRRIPLAQAQLGGGQLDEARGAVGEQGVTAQLINRAGQTVLLEQQTAQVEVRDGNDIAAIPGQGLAISLGGELWLARAMVGQPQQVPRARLLRNQLGRFLQFFHGRNRLVVPQKLVAGHQSPWPIRRAALLQDRSCRHQNQKDFAHGIFFGHHESSW